MVRNEQIPEMGAFARAVARAVRDAVEEAGVSGSELGRRLMGPGGKPRAQSYASLRLNGRKAWTLDELDVIAGIVDVSVDDLMERARKR